MRLLRQIKLFWHFRRDQHPDADDVYRMPVRTAWQLARLHAVQRPE